MVLSLACSEYAAAYRVGVPAGHRRAPAASMGLFDGVKEAFSGGGDKPMVTSDRITPFDRWLGLDKDLEAAEASRVNQDIKYVDPSDTTNYVTVAIPKPMGISFVENDGECGGVFIEEVLPTGSAAAASPALLASDQLVSVDGSLVLGVPFDAALDAIKATTGETTKLVFFRGPTSFLYGPTAPAAEWYAENL